MGVGRRFRKALNVLVNGRNTLVHFGEPVRLRDALEDGMSEQRSVRWILRNLRASLRAQRARPSGPISRIAAPWWRNC